MAGNGKRPRLDDSSKSIRELELEIELARLRREGAAAEGASQEVTIEAEVPTASSTQAATQSALHQPQQPPDSP